MYRILVPEEVYNAFENVKRSLKNVTKDEQNLVFLSVFGTGIRGDLKILKEFASKHPTTYLLALVYGYTIDKELVLKTMIKQWLNQPYVENEEKDIEEFAKKVTRFFLTKSL